MNKYAYLEELRDRIGKLSQYQVDNLVNDYSAAISKMLDEYKDWDQIMREIGTPREAARRIFDGKPMYIRADEMRVSRENDRCHNNNNNHNYDNGGCRNYDNTGCKNYDNGNNRNYDNGGYQENVPQKKEKKKKGGFWRYYLMLGLVTIPLTIAFFVALFCLGVTSWSLMLAGPAAVVYAAVVGIFSGSPLLFFAYGGAALIVLGVGLLMWWLTKQFFWPLKAALRKKTKAAKADNYEE